MLPHHVVARAAVARLEAAAARAPCSVLCMATVPLLPAAAAPQLKPARWKKRERAGGACRRRVMCEAWVEAQTT